MGPPVSDSFVVITILQDKGPFFYGLWRLHKKFYTMSGITKLTIIIFNNLIFLILFLTPYLTPFKTLFCTQHF